MSCAKSDAPATHGGGPERAEEARLVVALDDVAATDVAVAGGKAAALATARRAGLPTLPGLVLTTRFAAEVGDDALDGHPAVEEAYLRAGGPDGALVARSSSVAEDTAESSFAGQFTSVIGVTGARELARAVRTVLDSATDADDEVQPMAVLVQPLLDAAVGGVLFGVDPVTGRSDRLVVSAVEGAPEPLVSGEVTGSRYVIDAAGAVHDAHTDEGPTLTRPQLRSLAALAARVRDLFGGPQDVEWAFDRRGRLRLLQSRPVTTEVRGVPKGPVYGPGPVAESFPAPLSRLEQDLWVPPLREAVREAVRLAGVASRARLAATEAVVVVDGRVAIDLGLTGDDDGTPSAWRRLDPRVGLRALRGAWRIGRLRSALPALADALIARVDADLAEVPALPDLTTPQLARLLRRSADALRSLHAHEVLMGALLAPGQARLTGTSLAIAALAEGRGAGLDDDAIIARDPVVLALAPPRVGPRPDLPAVEGPVVADTDDPGDDDALRREALRIRVRWVQELSGRAAWELGERLAAGGRLRAAADVRHITLAQLLAAAADPGLRVGPVTPAEQAAEPLPARFRLSDTGRPIAERPEGEDAPGGTGAGGGRCRGPVTHDTTDPPPGSVLVTTTLSPGLGPLLPRLGGIVAETGSVLSHLAILARESGVPTVVAFPGAVERLPEGEHVVVDGDTGVVLPDVGPPPAPDNGREVAA